MAKLRFERTILLVTLTALGITWILFSRDEVSQPRTVALTEAPIVGHLAPDFTLATPQGETVTLTNYVNRYGESGQPVILNYWASWCGPCRVETPELQDASLKFKNQVAFIGINQGESAQIVSEFALSYGLTYPLLVDEDSTVNRDYGVNSLPTTIFIDRKGVVREVFIGILNQAVLEDRIKRLLEEG
ncbi:MAG: TlpA family protein disulfide reductase [Ardenticatenaceae bacterium]|nr:TlpA family protein disulfide reductase [Ardenticatenaceae bacterium]MCB9446486.1 TlpA family protein disulfide reductase [Ardenticatenaceae bacterium]